MHQVSSITEMLLSAVTRLLQHMQLTKSLHRMHAIDENILIMGLPTVLTEHEEKLIVNHLKFLAQREAKTDVVIPKQIAAKIA